MTESGKESVAGCLVLLSQPVYFSDTVREWVFVDAGPVLAGLIGVVAMIVILRDHGIALRETVRQTKRVPEGSEPAIRQYFFSAAWKELPGSTQSAFLTVKDRYRDGFGVVGHLGEAGCLAIPVALVDIAALSAAAFVAAVTFAAGVALHCVIADVRASAEPPQAVYDRLVMTLREQRGGHRVDVPLAIIVTKAEALDIGNEPAREWLLQSGERNLVQSIEHDFKTVRFFACSSLGRIPSARADAFVPWGVVQPFEWLAETSGVSLR